jgi:hypothetical protein
MICPVRLASSKRRGFLRQCWFNRSAAWGPATASEKGETRVKATNRSKTGYHPLWTAGLWRPESLAIPAFDRTSSGVGYTRANEIPCCAICNIMKNKYGENQLFTKEFKIAMVFDPPDDVQKT